MSYIRANMTKQKIRTLGVKNAEFGDDFEFDGKVCKKVTGVGLLHTVLKGE
jgi:hypothetical protein